MIKYNDNEVSEIFESEYYLSSRITRTGSALPVNEHRIGLGHKRADNLKCLWRGTGINRKRKLELVDSLIGPKILYSLETLNITENEKVQKFKKFLEKYTFEDTILSIIEDKGMLISTAELFFDPAFVSAQGFRDM